MKKYLFILLFFSVFLTACQRNDYVELDFDPTVNLFSQQIESITNNIQKLGFSKQIYTELDVDLKWENKDFDFTSKINLTWNLDFFDNNKDLLIHSTLFFDDKKEKQTTNVAWFLHLLSVQQQNFIQLSDFYVDLWPANYQNNLFLLISKYLENKRIFTNKDQNNFQKDIIYLLQNISFFNIFENIQTTKYNTKLAYKVQIKENVLNNLNQNQSFQIKDFQWLLIVLNSEEVELKIEEATILFNEKLFSIKGFVSKNSFELLVGDVDNPNNIHTYKQYSWSQSKNNHNFAFKNISNYQEDIVLSLSINNKQNKDKTTNSVIGSIIFSPKFIYWTNIEKEIQINITAKQNIIINSGFSVQLPKSYIHLDQILWDNFSLKNILVTDNS